MEDVLPICRVCLIATNESVDFQTRFECKEYPQDDANSINYLECLRFCTNLPIEEDDDGPQCLCPCCEAELKVVYAFIRKAQTTQDILEESWQGNDFNNKVTEHTEILIEKLETDDVNDGNDDEDEFEEDYDGEYDEDNCEDLYEYELSSNYNEEDETLDTSDDNLITEIEEVIIKELQPDKSKQKQYLPEDSNKDNSTSKDTKCGICNRMYKSPRLLKIHLNYHKRRERLKNSFSCDICGKTFPLLRYLTQHLTVHDKFQETHECEHCKKEFTTKTALTSHKRIHQEQKLNCNECGKQFKGTYELKIHMRFHKREKKTNKCEICRKEFTSHHYLDQHMVVHVDDRPTYKCTYCKKIYFSKIALNNHKRLHEGNALECEECGKRFTRPNELRIHMRFHRGEKPFECTMCDKRFTIKGHLKTHMEKHQNIKNECEKCSKLFKSKKALKEHSYTHNKMPFPCDYCNKAYPSKQKYKIHLEKVHSSEMQEIDLSQRESSQNSKSFTYIEIIEEEEDNEDNQINEQIEN